MQSKNEDRRVLDKITSFLNRRDDFGFLYETLDFSKFRDIGNRVLYLNDFYLFLHQKPNDLDELNKWFSSVRSGINLERYLVKGENEEFRVLNETRLGFARVWYEEVVAQDKIVSKCTREFFDPKLIPSDATLVDGEKNTIEVYDDANNNPFGDGNRIKRRVRLFFYPSEEIAKKAKSNELSPASSMDLTCLK